MRPWLDRSGRFSPLKAAIFAALFLPAAWIAFAYFSGRLEPLPIIQALRNCGLRAIRLLLISLAVTPLRRLFHWACLVQARRMIGVAAFAYAAAHFSLYVVDQSFALGTVASEIARRVYLTIGFAGLLGLSALAATSTDAMLHRLVYAIGLLGSIHYFLQSKAAVSEPTVMAGVFLWLMGYRAILALLGEDRRLPLWGLVALALGAAVLTALGEAGYFWLRMGVDPARVLVADLMFRFGPRPAWIVLMAGLVVAALALSRQSAGRQNRERRAERRCALAAEAGAG